MRKILVFKHVAHEVLGTLTPLLRGQGFRIRYVNFNRTPEAVPSLDKYDGLVLFGGWMAFTKPIATRISKWNVS